MRNLKILFISLGVLSSICVLVWDTGKHELKKSGIEYVHSAVYSDPILKSRIGDVTVLKTIKQEGESIGNKYFLRTYENIHVRGGDAMAVAVVWRVDRAGQALSLAHRRHRFAPPARAATFYR